MLGLVVARRVKFESLIVAVDHIVNLFDMGLNRALQLHARNFVTMEIVSLHCKDKDDSAY